MAQPAAHIQLPPPLSAGVINKFIPPEPPTIPPSNSDIARARDHSKALYFYRKDLEQATDDDFAEAVRYEARLLAYTSDGQPPQQMKQRIDRLEERMTRTERNQAYIQRIVAKWFNSTSGGGLGASLEVVPFPNGQIPSEEPYNLPPLDSLRAVHQLQAQQRDLYYSQYYPDGVAPDLERVDLIISAIGLPVR